MTARKFLKALLKALRLPFRRLHGRASVAFGLNHREKPLCRNFGSSRGTPIDRYYIENFLKKNASDIGGQVLEVGDDAYSRRFGGSEISKQDILHVDPDAARATITGDLGEPGLLPPRTFDCIVLTQTLHLIFDMAAALREMRQSLRPGGVLLITVPGVSAIDPGPWKDSWYWSLTERSLRELLLQCFDDDCVEVRGFGNVFAATAFLHGAAVEEVNRRKLDPVDPAYPVTITARASVPAGEA